VNAISSQPHLPTFATDEARRAALAQRDASADGHFVYAVKTTGVYGRPSCSARPARPDNLSFFDTCEMAEAAGFRACQRCLPNTTSLEQLYADKMAAACRSIEATDEPPNLEELAASAAMSRYHFHRVFKRIIGLTPKAYAQANRAERMRRELGKGQSVTEAVYEAGYHSNGRFYAESKAILGMPAKRYRKQGQGVTIRFAVGECSLGSVLVASTDKGVCAILLGDDPNELAIDLQNRFAQAELIGGDADYEQTVAQVVGFIDQPGSSWTLPLDIRGTAFQERVWQALREIPSGQTVTYSELAERLGTPKAARAIAGACAANRIAVAIPCHRVVRNDGSLSGYRWGVERKRQLLQRESQV